MKRFLATTLIALAVLAFGGLALAQGVPAVGPVTVNDLSSWFLDIAVLGGVVAAAVSFIRKRIWTTMDGIAVNIVAIAIGVLFTLLGRPLELHAMDWIPSILYGIGAGLAATGLVELGRTVSGKRSGG